MNDKLDKAERSQTPYVIGAIFLMVISMLMIIVPTALYRNFSYEHNFYITGEKVDGVVTGYIRSAGARTVNQFVVILIVKYTSEDGIEYTLRQRANEYIYSSEEVVKQEIGKTRPMVIDGKGNCLTGVYDESYYKNAKVVCITFIIVGSISMVLNLYWLYKSIKTIIKKRAAMDKE